MHCYGEILSVTKGEIYIDSDCWIGFCYHVLYSPQMVRDVDLFCLLCYGGSSMVHVFIVSVEETRDDKLEIRRQMLK